MRTLILSLCSLLTASAIYAQTWISYPATKGEVNYAYETPYGQIRCAGYFGQSISADYKYLYKSFDKDTGAQGFTVAPDGVYLHSGIYAYTNDSNGSMYSIGGNFTIGRSLTKISSNGAVALDTLLDLGWNGIYQPITLKTLSNGDLIYVSHYINNSKVYRIDTTGQIIWEKQFNDYEFAQQDIQELPNGDLRYTIFNAYAGPDLTIYHLQSTGQVMEEYIEEDVTDYQINNLQATEDGVLLVTNSESYFDSILVKKYDYQANLRWEYPVPTYVTSLGKEVVQMQSNRIAVIGQSYGFQTDSIFVAILDTTGTTINRQVYPLADETVYNSVELMQDGGLLIAGRSFFVTGNAPDIPFILKTDSLGESATKYIHGKLFQDYNDDCDINAGDYAMANWLVGLVNGTDTTYHTTNSAGQYTFLVNEGSYELTVQLYTPFFDYCSPQTIVNVP
ncbi:MAG: hypothetical protein KDC44_23270, partial [Phaeodactylibacter sp.]|nr:hypothetical protein [Phaeodactylibacter sp.]